MGICDFVCMGIAVVLGVGMICGMISDALGRR
jgi:hypothetical protein